MLDAVEQAAGAAFADAEKRGTVGLMLEASPHRCGEDLRVGEIERPRRRPRCLQIGFV